MDLWSVVGAAAVGATAWSGSMVLIALSALMPWLVFRQPSSRAGFAVAAAYFGGANWPIIPATLGFYDSNGTVALGAAFWVGATVLQAVPWMLRSRWSYLVSAVPPFGIIGWASPLTAAERQWAAGHVAPSVEVQLSFP